MNNTSPTLVNRAGIDQCLTTPTGDLVRQSLTAHCNNADNDISQACMLVRSALVSVGQPRECALTLRDRFAALQELHGRLDGMRKDIASSVMTLARQMDVAKDAYVAADESARQERKAAERAERADATDAALADQHKLNASFADQRATLEWQERVERGEII